MAGLRGTDLSGNRLEQGGDARYDHGVRCVHRDAAPRLDRAAQDDAAAAAGRSSSGSRDETLTAS
jgi:hypothetical protein